MRKAPFKPRRSRLRSTKPAQDSLAAESQWLKTRDPIKRKKRTAAEFARIYGSKERVGWVKALNCAACDIDGLISTSQSDNAHTVTDGMGRKAHHSTIVPLCPTHHRLYDEHQPPFDRHSMRYAMKLFAADVERRWQEQSK